MSPAVPPAPVLTGPVSEGKTPAKRGGGVIASALQPEPDPAGDDEWDLPEPPQPSYQPAPPPNHGLDAPTRHFGPGEGYSDFAPAEQPERPTVMAFQSIPPPVEERKRRIRYDLLAGAGLVLALLALVPLLFLRSDPEELRTTPQIPDVGAQQRGGEVEIILNEPVDLTDKVELSWRASIPELNFAVVIAAEGEEDVEVRMAERNMKMTVNVRPGIQYCFLIQAVEASHEDDVYQSDPRGLRGATCTQ